MEISSLTTNRPDDSYIFLLTKSFANRQDVTIYAHFFNFLHMHHIPRLDPIHVIPEENKIIPFSLYDSLRRHNLASSFDSILPGVDITIFGNGVHWPTVKTRLTAVIINNSTHLHDATPRALEAVDFVITTSDFIKNELINEFDYEPADCVVIDVPSQTVYDNTAAQRDIDVTPIVDKVNKLVTLQ